MMHEKKRNAVKRTLVKQDRTASLSVVYWSNVYSFEGGRVGGWVGGARAESRVSQSWMPSKEKWA